MWISHRYISVMGAAINCAFIGEENPREGCGIREVRHGVHSVDGVYTSLTSAKHFPFIWPFIRGNKKKLHGARSGEWRG